MSFRHGRRSLRVLIDDMIEPGVGEVRCEVTFESTGRWVVSCLEEACGFGTATLTLGAATERAYLHVATTHGGKR